MGALAATATPEKGGVQCRVQQREEEDVGGGAVAAVAAAQVWTARASEAAQVAAQVTGAATEAGRSLDLPAVQAAMAEKRHKASLLTGGAAQVEVLVRDGGGSRCGGGGTCRGERWGAGRSDCCS